MISRFSSLFHAAAACSFIACTAFAARSYAQDGPEPVSVPVALSTHKTEVIWGTTERRRETVASASRDGNNQATDTANTKNVSVQGLRGTLNQDDVHQTMEARQHALNQCTQRTRRGLGWVSGHMRFAFQVDAQGHISKLRPLVSSVGHYELEQCLTQVVQDTQFPKPSGHATADFSWGMNIEPAGSHALKQLRAGAIAPHLRKHRSELRKQCELPRRSRLKVTAYVSATGQIVSSGAVASSAATQHAVPCVLDQLAKWRLPKQKHMAKITFGLP